MKDALATIAILATIFVVISGLIKLDHKLCVADYGDEGCAAIEDWRDANRYLED